MKVKCLVWDLDDTLWNGTLLEGGSITVPEEVRCAVQGLDERGILQSIVSRNDASAALARLEALGLAEYFLEPQIGWGAKSASLRIIQERLGIGMDEIAFIDDQPFELEEVRFSLPEVRCIAAADRGRLLDMPELRPAVITEDSRRRRELYRRDALRRKSEERFEGAHEDFLATLGMVFTVSDATEDDLLRAEELTVRTHQLNTTGDTYGHDELAALLRCDRHRLLMAELEDRFGPYGKIGLALVERCPDALLVKLLLMSCRVVGRGVGSIMLHHLMRLARDEGLAIRARFRPNGRNEMMRVTYRFAGFREVARDGDVQILEARAADVPEPPAYVTMRLPAAW